MTEPTLELNETKANESQRDSGREEFRASNFGILDPSEPGHRLPEGLLRKRAGPMARSSQ